MSGDDFEERIVSESFWSISLSLTSKMCFLFNHPLSKFASALLRKDRPYKNTKIFIENGLQAVVI